MKNRCKLLTLAGVCITLFLAATSCSTGRLNTQTLMSGGSQVLQAVTLSDAQIQAYVKEYINYSDTTNKVLPESSQYTKRLRKLTAGLNYVEGIPLNFKVYETDQINAFACADGSVRVYSGLMDIMTDDEVLGVIGHEIGHVGLKHTRKQFQQSLLTTALRNGIASVGGVAAKLSSGQLGSLAQNLANSSFSRKQESQADEYGYDFLVKNRKNPYYMAMAFEKLSSATGGNSKSNVVSNLFSSHPDVSKRIAKMVQKAEKDGYTRPSSSFTGSPSSSTKGSTKTSTKNVKTVKVSDL